MHGEDQGRKREKSIIISKKPMYVWTYVCIYNEALFGSHGDILGIGRGKNNDGKGWRYRAQW